MKYRILFSLQSVSDSDLEISKKEMAQIRLEAFKRAKLAALLVLVIIAISVPIPVIGVILFMQWVFLNVWRSEWVIMLLMFSIFPFAFFLAYFVTRTPLFIRPIRRELRRRGIDICLKCGYWLKELPLEKSNHCPECGSERVPLPEVNPTKEPDSPS